jgi:hypothetical protein
MFWNSISVGGRRNRYSGDFGEMEQHSSPQKDCAKVGRLFLQILGSVFLGMFGIFFADIQKNIIQQ